MLGLFIFGIICLIIGAGLYFVRKKTNQSKVLSAVAGIAILLALVMVIASCVRTVPTGHTGIVTAFGSVQDYTYEAGVHFTAPWLDVINMDNRNQKQRIDLSCFSSDIQEVSVIYTLNYQIQKSNAQTIYKTIGTDYYQTVIEPRVQEAVKSVMAKYTAEELLSNRAELSKEIRSILTEKLEAYHVEVLDTSLENLDFSDAFTDAVEAKQVAEQKAKQAQIEQDQKTMEAEAAAKRAAIDAEAAANVAVIAANADLDVVKIQADAAEYAGQKDAAVIGQLRDIMATNPDDLTDEDIEHLLVYYYIQAWDGKLPETYIGAEDFYALLSSLATRQAN